MIPCFSCDFQIFLISYFSFHIEMCVMFQQAAVSFHVPREIETPSHVRSETHASVWPLNKLKKEDYSDTTTAYCILGR